MQGDFKANEFLKLGKNLLTDNYFFINGIIRISKGLVIRSGQEQKQKSSYKYQQPGKNGHNLFMIRENIIFDHTHDYKCQTRRHVESKFPIFRKG